VGILNKSAFHTTEGLDTTLSAGDEDRGRDPFEEAARRLDKIASRLKPFATGRACPVDYDRIELPRPSDVFFLTPTPQPAPPGVIPRDLLVAETICDRTVGLHLLIAEEVIGARFGPDGFVEKDSWAGVQVTKSFKQLALAFGYAGMVIRRARQDPQPLAADVVDVWSQGTSKPPDVLRDAAVRVAHSGPRALDELSLDQPTRQMMRRSIDKGVPVLLRELHQKVVTIYASGLHRTASSKEIEEAEDLLTEIGVYWLLGFRWRWCTYRREPHWYVADYHEQSACVRHRNAVQQHQFRHPEQRSHEGR